MTKEELRRIWAAIPWDKPKDSREISDDAFVPRGRTCEAVREAVRQFRDWGLPVVSCDQGFYKTTIARRLAGCARTMYRRASAIQDRADRLLERVEEGWPPGAYEDSAEKFLYNGEEEQV